MLPKRLGLMAIVVLALSLAFSLVSQAKNQEPGPLRKIVVFQEWVVDQATQDEILAKAGAKKIKPLPLVNGAAALVTPASERLLKAHPAVLDVEDDARVYALPLVGAKAKPTPTPPPPAEVLPWGVDRIDADLVWATNTGAGVKVAVLDTGIDLDHPDLVNNLQAGYSAVDYTASPDDDDGHGTHVAGIIAALDNDIGVIGVAPGASLYAVKVLDYLGEGYVSDVIEGLQWCIQNGMQVVNMSFGTTSNIRSFQKAIAMAYKAGIVLVASAGNDGPTNDTVNYPAKYREVIAVSATDSSDGVPWWSSRGREVELAAPGDGIYSTYIGGGYGTMSGTSMASPHVAGTAALVLKSLNATVPDKDVRDQVRGKLRATADDLGDPGKDNLYGYGLVDAQEAATGTETLP